MSAADWGRPVRLARPIVGGCRDPTLGDGRDERSRLGGSGHSICVLVPTGLLVRFSIRSTRALCGDRRITRRRLDGPAEPATAAGLLLATFAGEPWHVYVTLGMLVGAGTTFTGYTGQALFLPNWFVRRRGLAMSIAFAGVGFGSIVMLPALQAFVERHGWRAGCTLLGVVALVVLVPLNLLLRRRPEDIGLAPDGDADTPAAAQARRVNVVDPAWAAVDWTLPRAMRTARFWWIAVAYFSALFSWYAVQVHQTKYLVETGFGAQ